MDTDFESGVSGASKTFPKQCSALRKGEYVMLKGNPCKIVDMSTSKTGKHGHAKVHLTGIDIFDTKKYEDICPSTHNMECPNVVRKEYLFMSLDDDNFMDILLENGDVSSDIKVDDEMAKTLRKAEETLPPNKEIHVTVIRAVDREKVLSYALKEPKK